MERSKGSKVLLIAAGALVALGVAFFMVCGGSCFLTGLLGSQQIELDRQRIAEERAACAPPRVFRLVEGGDPLRPDAWECVDPDAIPAADHVGAGSEAGDVSERAEVIRGPASPAAEAAEPDPVAPGWLARWQAAEAALTESGDAAPAMALFEAVAPPECDASCRAAATGVRTRIERWARYASEVDSLGDRVSEALAIRAPFARMLTVRATFSTVDEVPVGCPAALCTAARARVIAQQRQRARSAERAGVAALQRHAVSYGRAKAARMDAALTGTNIDGTFRAEGRDATELVLRYALCSRPTAEAIFLQSLEIFRREGFTWVGCRSSFRRYGWTLEPPPLEQQSIVDAAALGLE